MGLKYSNFTILVLPCTHLGLYCNAKELKIFIILIWMLIKILDLDFNIQENEKQFNFDRQKGTV
jgi:hypothetical protein